MFAWQPKEILPQVAAGEIYLEGVGVPKDSHRGTDWIRKAAEQGYGPADAFIGEMYALGEGVKKDEKTGVEWFQKGTDKGDSNSEVDLARAYYLGTGGLKKNLAQAIELWRKAVEQDNPVAEYSLGMCYVKGEGVAAAPDAQKVKEQVWIWRDKLQTAQQTPASAETENTKSRKR